MPIGKFLLAIFTGRCIRFLTVGILTIELGPQFVHWSGAFFQRHFWRVVLVLAVGLAIWLWVRKKPAPLPQPAAD
jgi:membrane protein DedA with SNARE-associated domain